VNISRLWHSTTSRTYGASNKYIIFYKHVAPMGLNDPAIASSLILLMLGILWGNQQRKVAAAWSFLLQPE
jgi:hypothetical protein